MRRLICDVTRAAVSEDGVYLIDAQAAVTRVVLTPGPLSFRIVGPFPPSPLIRP
jgi:hypothetical protein